MSYREAGDIEALFDPGPVEEAMERVVRRLGDVLLERVRAYTPIQNAVEAQAAHRVPGTARRSWRIIYGDGATGTLSVEVASDDQVVEWLERGTRPHEIRPRTDRAPASIVESARPRATRDGKAMERQPTAEELRAGVVGKAALRFHEEGHVIYARVVHHPGTRALHMMARALQDVRVQWELVAEEEFKRAGEELERRAAP